MPTEKEIHQDNRLEAIEAKLQIIDAMLSKIRRELQQKGIIDTHQTKISPIDTAYNSHNAPAALNTLKQAKLQGLAEIYRRYYFGEGKL